MARFFFRLYLAFDALCCNAHSLYDMSFCHTYLLHLPTLKCHLGWTFSSNAPGFANGSLAEIVDQTETSSRHIARAFCLVFLLGKMSSLQLTTKIAMNCEINGKMISCCYQVTKLFNLYSVNACFSDIFKSNSKFNRYSNINHKA